MREILFRGKGKDGGEWLYGFYHNETSIESPSSDRKITRHHIYTQDFDKFVIPKTVGQFTGFTDKNGTKIFEGDIVRYSNGYGYIAWAEQHGAFMCVEENGEYWEWFDIMLDIEVIGNKWDNPELLGE